MKRQTTIALILLTSVLTAGLAAQTAEVPADPRIQTIMSRVQDGDLEGALALLEEMSQEEQLPVAALAMKGALQVELGDDEGALATLSPLAADPNADPAVLYNTGRAALALGDLQLAESVLERSIRLMPTSPAARELGLIWAQMGRYPDAYRLLRPWAMSQPQDTEARMAAALCAVQLQRPGEAEGLLADLDQTDPKVQLLQGKILLDKADPYGAIAALEPLVQNAPPELEVDARRTLADAKAAVGQAAEAVELLDGYVQGNPSVALQLAQAQYQSGDLETARATLQPFAEVALEQLPQTEVPAEMRRIAIGLVTEYGRLLVTGGEHEAAIPYLELSTQLAPENKQSWQQLGQAYAGTGQRDKAQEALETFQGIVETEVPGSLKDLQMEADVEDPTGRVLREASKVFADGDTEAALDMLRGESEMAPGDPRPFLLAARFLLAAERADEALAVASEVTRNLPENADGHYITATILMAMRDFAGAESAFRQALELNPEHAASLNDLAVLYMEQGRNSDARPLLERALQIRPDDALAAENLKALDKP